jgi:uncharacterized protein involved in exopolysaccharide biosynthesis
MDNNIQDEINLMDYIQVIRKKKWLILIGTLLCMVIAGVVSFMTPKVYEARAYLMITAPKYNVEFASKEGSKISTPLFDFISAETFSKIILNEHTAKSVIIKLGLDQPPHQYTVRKILGQIKPEYQRNTNLILLKGQDTSKERAASIVNAWAAAFIERNEENTSKGSSDTYNFVMVQLEKVKITLKTAEEELERFQKTNKIELLKEQIAGKIKQIVQYENQFDDAVRSQLTEKARYDELTSQIKEQERTIPVDKGLIGKEEINPLYIHLISGRADTAITIRSLNAEILQLKENIKGLNAEVTKLKGISAEQELIQTRLARNVETAKSTFDVLSKKGEETKISSSIKSATIQLSVPASVPESPIKPNKRQNVMIAAIVGLLASIMLAFFMEFLEKNKTSLKKPV